MNDCLTRGNFIIYENYEANIKTTLRKVGLTSLIEFTDQIHLFDTVALSISQHWFKKENSNVYLLSLLHLPISMIQYAVLILIL